MNDSYHHGDLRRALIEAAVTAISEGGPSSLSLRAVAKRAGVSHAAPAHHFGDKAGLLTAVAAEGHDRFLDLDRSLAEGAILLPGFGNGGYWYSKYADIGSFDADTPLREWTGQERDALLYGGERAARLGTSPPSDYEGVVERFERIHLRTSDDLSDRKRKTIEEFTRISVCPDCRGERLNEASRTVTVEGRTIGQMSRLDLPELREVIGKIDRPEVASVVRALLGRLDAMTTIGLGYLHLARATTTLSGGESQRIKAVNHLGSSLIEMLYIFDEPTVGLHPHDVESMATLLQQLRDRGNTVLVVEHDPALMTMADEIIEIGPDAGDCGGRLVFQGGFGDLLTADTPTSRALAAPRSLIGEPRTPRGWITVSDAERNNLRNVTVEIPLGVMTVLTGVAGSGKSSLAAEIVAQHPAIVVDQKPVAANRRSTPITYTGIATALRKLFARRTRAPESLFSANSTGGCPDCKGLGVLYTDLAFMDGQETVCPACQGTKFTAAALSHTVDGLTIADVEHLTITDALDRLDDRAIRERLRHLHRVGLGYLRLAQPLNTLSGGEAQRVKIARELRETEEPNIYVLDEPTTGLHLRDVGTLLDVLDDLIDHGQSVVVIEHDLDVIRRADWVIDLGPGPGRHGGEVLYSGAVGGLTDTATGRALGALRE